MLEIERKQKNTVLHWTALFLYRQKEMEEG